MEHNEPPAPSGLGDLGYLAEDWKLEDALGLLAGANTSVEAFPDESQAEPGNESGQTAERRTALPPARCDRMTAARAPCHEIGVAWRCGVYGMQGSVAGSGKK